MSQLLLLSTFILSSVLFALGSLVGIAQGSSPQVSFAPDVNRVPVILGVMSRCPDALFCESVFDKVLQKTGHEIVDIQLTFIGRLNSSDREYGATCMHGPFECAGNIQELCVAKYTSYQSQIWWPFVQCLNSKGRDKIGLDLTGRSCAYDNDIEWVGDIEECVDGEEGRVLLRESIQDTDAVGISSSCTIIINEKTRCVYDSGWKDCEDGHDVDDFVRRIRHEYLELNP